jgi:Lysozyme like domain
MSKGRHRHVHVKGRHRRPSTAARAAQYTGGVAATGFLTATLAAVPAGAMQVPQVTSAPAATATTDVISATSYSARAAWLHWRHLRHEEHEAYLHEHQYHQYHTASYNYPSGVLSPAQIGELWLNAGGSRAAEGTAECIAHFESGGNTNAISPTNDYGVWQINGSWGPEKASLNPVLNAEAAVQISDDGTNWSPWTTAGDCGV